MASSGRTVMAVDPLVEPQGMTRSGAARVEAIDMLRGLVIAIMVLDHVRDFFHIQANLFDPTDPTQTYPLLYLTRWVTHLCAPTFVFLSGVSIYLQRANGKTGGRLARFLLSRGAWLVLLELTVIMFAWNFGRPFWFLQVIWAIGCSMMAMAALAQLPSRAVLAIGVAFIGLSPLVLTSGAPAGDAQSIVMNLLFGGTMVTIAPVFIAYAIVPWLGVMCLGFGLGPIFEEGAAARRRRLLRIALGLIALFFALRTLNGYGNPQPWRHLATPAQTAMSYFNAFKYPPSPDYVSITIGLSLLVFLAIGHLKGPLARILGDFGRTPLFTYVAHLYIAHGLMLAAALALGRPEAALDYFYDNFHRQAEQKWGWSAFPSSWKPRNAP